MEKDLWKKRWALLCLMVQLFLLTGSSLEAPIRSPGSISSDETDSSPPVRLYKLSDHHVVISNGLVNVTLSTPAGMVTRIQFNEIDNVLGNSTDEADTGYWDVNWSRPESNGTQYKLSGTTFKVILQTPQQVEVSFTKTWDNGSGFPVNVDKRFIMLNGSSGFYSYAIFDRLGGWPGLKIGEARIVFKLQETQFNYMAISDKRQKVMPTFTDRINGQVLDYKEAVRLINPSNPELQGVVDDKYQYSCDNKDNRVHGWISDELGVGFWMITASNEFRVGGPLRQDLTSHCGPTVLSKFITTHYAGKGTEVNFTNGEPWKKVFGPVFVYLNKDSTNQRRQKLWEDAKAQMNIETGRWPYSFPQSPDYYKSNQRGSVKGQLLVLDRYVDKQPFSPAVAYVGLAPPGEAGSWQYENKGYQFWTEANKGEFSIEGVRVGTYNLFAWVPGTVGDYKYDAPISITPGSNINLKSLVYEPPRSGATLWEIGVPDRTAAEFFIPDPDPSFMNPLYIEFDRFRQYGLWKRYSEIYPYEDLIYIVGVSNYAIDWFYAHVTRNMGGSSYQATTWQIIFDLNEINKPKNYTLRLALASANSAELQVRVNKEIKDPPDFTTGQIGKDNAIARHGIHGLYHLYEVKISGTQLVSGKNTIFLTQTNAPSPFAGLMYDYIRLEEPLKKEFKR